MWSVLLFFYNSTPSRDFTRTYSILLKFAKTRRKQETYIDVSQYHYQIGKLYHTLELFSKWLNRHIYM